MEPKPRGLIGKSEGKYVMIGGGVTVKDGFKFGIGFWLASTVISVIVGLIGMSLMGFIAAFFQMAKPGI